MKSTIELFKIFNIKIKLHFSWWFVFLLLLWSLATSFFPYYYPNLPSFTYWTLSFLATILLFVSILLHELSHSLVAQQQKIKVNSITLFFFGGIANITDDELKPTAEFLMSIAGPLFSLILSGISFLIYYYANFFSLILLSAVTFYLWQINLILAIFNLIPAFPLDGGRALRAILTYFLKNNQKATLIASKGGKIFSFFLMLLGILNIINSNLNGIWFLFLGGFLYFLAGSSYEQLILKEILKKIKIKEILKKKYISLNPQMNLKEFINKYLNTEESSFIVKDKLFQGILDLKKIGKMSPAIEERIKLFQISLPFSEIKPLSLNDNGYTAYHLFQEQKLELLPVMDGKKIIGVVKKKTLLHHLIWELKFGIREKKEQKSKNNENKKKKQKKGNRNKVIKKQNIKKDITKKSKII